MIIENFFNVLNIFSVCFFLIFFFLINNFFTEINVRKKFFLFLIIFLSFICIGLYYNLDGIIFLFTISELSVLLIFITMFSQLYSHTKKNSKLTSFLFFYILIILNFNYFDVKILSHNNFYSYYNIDLNDFYYIYNFYFEKQILLTIFIILIISLYSIFFILLYFNMKKKQNIEQNKVKQVNLLRKQNIIHQSNYNTTIRNFQK